MTTLAATLQVPAGRPRARIVDALTAPWFAGSRATRWWAIGLFAVMTIGALGFGIFTHQRRGVEAALILYAIGAAILMMWLATLLLLARDGHRLCLPGVVRNSAYSVCFYALASVLAPAVVVGVAGGDITAAIVIPALAVAACLAYMLLPLAIGVWLGFIPAVYIGLHNLHLVPSPFDPGFRTWAWLALVVLVVIDLVRWRQFLHGDDKDDSTWHRTMLSQMGGNMFGKWASIDQRWAWRRSGSKPAPVDFRNVAPAKPAKVIEVALGGWYVPQTVAGRLGSLARVALPVLLFIPLLLFMNLDHAHSLRRAWQGIGVVGGLWVGLFGGAMLTLITGAVLQRRWKNHAGVALLALLPGLGGRDAALHVARAALTKPAIAFVVLWLCMLVPTAVLHQGPMAVLLCTLIMGGMAALTAMAVLMVLAGRSLHTFTLVGLGVLVLVLVNVSATIGIVTHGSAPGAWTVRVQWLVVLVWLALIAWAAWRARRAWQALRRRPQPFLANVS